MRQATREYPVDWMIAASFGLAQHLRDGTDKEYRNALRYIPYFRGIVESIFDQGEPGRLFIRACTRYFDHVVKAHERGHKRAITTFCFSPALLYAMDIVPVCLEVMTVIMTLSYRRGTAEFLDTCNEVGFTETSCSSQRGSLGAYLAGVAGEIDLVVTDTPGVCDTNANAFAFAAAYLDKPFFQLDYPPVLRGERSQAYHREDFRALIRFLEEQTGRRLEPARLRAVLEEIKAQDDLCAELEDLARAIPNPLPVVFNFMMYAGRFLFSGLPECTDLFRAMLKVGHVNARRGVSGLRSGQERIRALFCYIDHYSQNLQLWQMLEDLGIGYQGNILSKHWAASMPYAQGEERQDAGYRIDLSDLDAQIDSLAMQNARMPMVKSIRGPYDAKDMWLEDTLWLARLYQADCVVYSGTPGCRNTWGMVKLFARDLEKAGYPTHIMYSDAFDERVQSFAATRERFEEFLHVRGLLP